MAEEFLADVTISKVYKGKEGEGQYGKWIAWNFYVNGDERKFSYFSGGKKPAPKEGMHLKMMRFEVKQSGQYTNYNVSEIFVNGNEKPSQAKPDAPQSTISKKRDSTLTMYQAYAKDLLVSHMHCFPNDWQNVTFDQLCEISVMSGTRMYDMANGEKPIRERIKNTLDEMDDNEYELNQTFADGTPIPKEPPF